MGITAKNSNKQYVRKLSYSTESKMDLQPKRNENRVGTGKFNYEVSFSAIEMSTTIMPHIFDILLLTAELSSKLFMFY